MYQCKFTAFREEPKASHCASRSVVCVRIFFMHYSYRIEDCYWLVMDICDRMLGTICTDKQIQLLQL